MKSPTRQSGTPGFALPQSAVVCTILAVVFLTTPEVFAGQAARALERDRPLRAPEEIVSLGFSRSRVVMMNEAHDGGARCVRTRQIGTQILPAAHEAGCRHLAMEALTLSFADRANRERRLPEGQGYLADPELRVLMQTALDLGWSLVPYEADGTVDGNRRNREQAKNLAAVVETLGPTGKLLVWCGNGHATKVRIRGWRPMGFQFKRRSGIDPFVIDQNRTVRFDATDNANNAFLVCYGRQLSLYRAQTAGFLVEDIDPALQRRVVTKAADAYLLSTRNDLE